MAFEVSVAPAVTDYLNACERLTDADRDRILASVTEELGDGADRFFEHNPHPFLPNRFWDDDTLIPEAGRRPVAGRAGR